LSATAPRRKKSEPADVSPIIEREALFSISPALYLKFQRLIHEEAGIWLGEAKSALLCGRLSRRLRALKMSSLEDYYEFVAQPHQEGERVAMIDAIATNETRFFRDPRHFEFLEQRVIPRWREEAQQGRRTKTVRLWSAGCSSGEEPYSLAMLLARHLPCDQGWSVQILATDISTKVLAHARLGIYNLTKSNDIPEPLLKDYMLKGIDQQDGQMKVMPQIQAMIEFDKLNLVHGPYPPEMYFDVVFCRNVLIYFDQPSKQKVIEHCTRCLAHNGFLFVGQAENLSTMKSQLRTLAPAIYARAGEHSGD
jgi:chemotaxis protein methyltransferase CheR